MNFSAHHPNHGAPAPIGYGEEFAKPPMQATRWLALGTVAGSILFALSWLVLGFLRSGYSPVS